MEELNRIRISSRLNWRVLRRLLWPAGFTAGITVLLLGMCLRAWDASDAAKPARMLRAKSMLRALEKDLHDGNAAERMQEVFPEGAVFTLSLYSQGLVNVCLNCPEDRAFRRDARREILWALERLSDRSITKSFPDTRVPHGAFFLSHRTLLIAGLHLIDEEPPAELTREYHDNCRMLARAILASPHGLLDSYPNGCWPADNLLALRCIALHDEHFGTDTITAKDRCLGWMQDNLDRETMTIPHKADSSTGEVLIPTRGCTMVLGLQYLRDIDEKMFDEQYARMRKHFLGSLMGLAVWREYPKGRNGPLDVDSGPIVFGGGSSATGVGMGTALLAGDYAVYCDEAALVESFAFPSENNSGRRYWEGLLPVADGFAVVSMTAVPWTKKYDKNDQTQLSGAVRPWKFLGIVGGVWLVLFSAMTAWCIVILRSAGRGRPKVARWTTSSGVLIFFLQALPLLLLIRWAAAFIVVWIALGFVLLIVRILTAKGADSFVGCQ